jgi:hypothetical protein
MHRFLPVILQIPAEAVAEAPVNGLASQASPITVSTMFSCCGFVAAALWSAGLACRAAEFIGVALATAIVGLFYCHLWNFLPIVLKLMGLVVNAGGVVYLTQHIDASRSS